MEAPRPHGASIRETEGLVFRSESRFPFGNSDSVEGTDTPSPLRKSFPPPFADCSPRSPCSQRGKRYQNTYHIYFHFSFAWFIVSFSFFFLHPPSLSGPGFEKGESLIDIQKSTPEVNISVQWKNGSPVESYSVLTAAGRE